MRVKIPWIRLEPFLYILSCVLLTSSTLLAESPAPAPIIREEFDTLAQWKPLLFPKIAQHSSYEIVSSGSATKALRAISNASASALVWRQQFDIKRFPILRWRWKVTTLPKQGNPEKKSGDDYALRVYILFAYEPESAGLITKAKYEAAKIAYGEYPPAASLNYVWSSVPFPQRILTSPYIEATKLIALQHGQRHVGSWQEQEVDLLEDFRTAFGEDPPQQASLAIMTDSDNTQSSTEGFIDFVELRANFSEEIQETESAADETSDTP